MSTSGRYQSRVLSFFSQQSLRLRDQAGQALRRLKMAAVLGAQIVLYPVYVAFQTGRLIDRQIQQAAQRIFPQLRAARKGHSEPIETDTPIHNTLAAIHDWQLSLPSHLITIEPLEGNLDAFSANALVVAAQHDHVEIVVVGYNQTGLSHQPALSSPSSLNVPGAIVASTGDALTASPIGTSPIASNVLQIQAVASMVATRRLVLVSHCNEVLDILTTDQQLQLQKYIVWQIASYWRQQRRLGVLPPPELSGGFSGGFSGELPGGLSPELFLGNSQGTSQGRSPELAGVPVLGALTGSLTFLPLPKIRPTQLAPIRWFRQLMTWMQISPVAIATNLFQESRFVPLLESRLLPLEMLPPRLLPPNYLASSVTSTTAQSFPATPLLEPTAAQSLQQMSSPQPTQPAFLQWLQVKAQQIKAIPEKIATGILEQTGLIYSPPPLPPEFTQSTPVDHPSTAASADWLTMEGLFGGIPRPTRQATGTASGTKATPAKFQAQYPQQSQQPSSSKLQRATPDETHAQAQSAKSTLSVVDPESESASPTFTPNWIEAEVKLVQYEKHPLEQLLQWLDSGMVWLETKFSQVWRWLRDQM